MIKYAVNLHTNPKRRRSQQVLCMFILHVFCIQSFFTKILAGFYKDITNNITNKYVAVTI